MADDRMALDRTVGTEGTGEDCHAGSCGEVCQSWSTSASLQAGVAAAEADGLLDVISARAASGQTGAAWQRATLAAAERHHDRQHALAIMLDLYLHCAETGLPVHTWPVASPAR